MANAGTHLADIRDHPETAIAEAVVSLVGGRVLSRYGDATWDLSPYIPTRNGRQTSIRFEALFADGTCLTDACHAQLLESAKRFLYSRWRVKAPHSGKYICARTVSNNWRQLVALIKWMITEGIASFSALTSDLCQKYCASQGHLKGSTRIINLQVLTTYYDLSEYLLDRLPEYPWGDSAPIVLVGNGHVARANGSRMPTTEVIPTRILQLIVQHALDYLENRSKGLLAARDYAATVSSAERAAGLSERFGIQSSRELKEELTRLRTACHIVCVAFSGMRDSEVASLEVGCFAKRVGFDGEEYCWLKGMTYKLEEDPTPAEWMVPEIVGLAVDVATRLGAPARARCAERTQELEAALEGHVLETARLVLVSDLEEAKKHRHALLLTEKQLGRVLALGGGAAAVALRNFAAAAGVVVEQADMQGIVDRELVQVGQVWPLAPHQFRRTFAVFVARSLLGDVRYLREHFKHWSIDMTLYYARNDDGVDATVFAEVLTERDELQALILEKWIRSDIPLGGGGGSRIQTFRDRGDVKTVTDMREFCRKLGDDVFIRGTGHSWCMASGSGCGGQGLYDATRCVSCGEGVIDENHLQVWRGIRVQQIEVLRCPDLGMPAWQRCVDHLRKAEKVLADLGDRVDPFPIQAYA